MCFSLSCRIHVCQFKSHGLLTSFLKTADEVLDQWDTQSKRAPRWHTILSQHFDAQDVGEILVVGTSAGACQRCSTRLLWCLSFGCHVCFSLSCRIHVYQFKSHGLLTNFLQTADEVWTSGTQFMKSKRAPRSKIPISKMHTLCVHGRCVITCS